MKKLHFLAIMFLAILALTNYSCSTQGPDQSGAAETEKKNENVKVKSVCVYNYSANGLQVLSDVNDPKSHLTYVKLGESVNYLGIKDTLDGKEYSKIELSDGNSGWTRSTYIVENADPAAIIEKTPIYERPDILTKSSKKEFNEIDFVAVVDQKDDWLQVVGINTRNSGWIKKGVVSISNEDVAMAILAIKGLYDKNGDIQKEKIAAFIQDAPFSDSRIITILKDMTKDDAMEMMEGEIMGAESEVIFENETETGGGEN